MIVSEAVVPDEIKVGLEFLFIAIVLGLDTTKHCTEVHGLVDDCVTMSPKAYERSSSDELS
jgi:hypothetical protein